jgi:hypothetical protein
MIWLVCCAIRLVENLLIGDCGANKIFHDVAINGTVKSDTNAAVSGPADRGIDGPTRQIECHTFANAQLLFADKPGAGTANVLEAKMTAKSTRCNDNWCVGVMTRFTVYHWVLLSMHPTPRRIFLTGRFQVRSL